MSPAVGTSAVTAASRTVLVVGAGPAGLAAATAARERGASVTLLDAADATGGQYWRHLPAARPSANERALHHGWSTYTVLRDALERDPGCEIVLGAQVWAVEQLGTPPGAEQPSNERPSSEQPGGEHPSAEHEPADAAGAPASVAVHVLVGPPDGTARRGRTFRPDAVVLATGAHDRTLPFPGWDLPGVFTAGAAQAFAKGERVALGERVVIAGAGPFLLPVAASVAATGARVLGVYEASRVAGLVRGWLPKPWQLVGAAKKGGELAGYVGTHLRHRIPYLTGRAVVAAHGTDRVEAVTIADVDADWRPIAGTARRVEADAVCVSHGFTPRLELPIAAGCELTPERFVRVDEGQATSVPGVFAAGEITGIGGVDAALAEGEIAGHVAAGGSPRDGDLAEAVGARRTFTGFAARIEAAHGIRAGWTAWLDDDTIVCRCEEVPYGRLRETREATCASGLRSMKLTTRAGLGICQGRICGRTVEELIGTASAPGAPAASVTTDRRPIASPLRIGELAARDHPHDEHQTTTTHHASEKGHP
ncbi:Thioredoxin reductase [Agromyces sp. CF514]|uniref:FAD-dependent oxidoreductase n=1 Tax=Agromyces sp. CF514 TaxID=1881031 RepID=UPI0008E58E2E|nr:FAD-dependent oxidoreductase [Agromyces sp. CF514]SFR84702.1 Thioredoxin reductase [Agromyces sp. CF514]